MSDNISPLVMIPVTRIDPHPHNPRRDLGDLGDLVKSIKAQGIRQNLLLVEYCTGCPEGDDHLLRTASTAFCSIHKREPRFKTVIGHRRLEAAKQAGLTDVPASIADLTPAEQLELMLLENIQREDLTPIEEAEGLQGLLDLGVTSAAITKATGISAKTVKGRLQLLTLPEVAREKIHSGQGTLADAVALEAFADDPETSENLAKVLGTSDFAVALQRAKEEQKRTRAQAPVIARLIERGAALHVQGIGSDGVARMYGGHVQTVEDVDSLDLPEGSTYEPSGWQNSIMIFVPTGSEVPVAGDTPEAKAAREAEAEKWRLEAEARDRLLADKKTAYEVRDQWVREFTTMGKPTAKEAAAVAAAMGERLLMERAAPTTALGTWLGLSDMDSYNDAKVRKAVTKWRTGKAPAVVMLLWLHLVVGRYVEPSHRPVFAALEACGYTPSTLERSWYEDAPQAAQEADPEPDMYEGPDGCVDDYEAE